jgi:two-component system sensor histidine kinase KdpD
MPGDRTAAQFSPEELHRLGLVGLGLIHELATPLSTSVMSLQLLALELDGAKDLPRDVIASRVHAEIERLQKTVNTVHRFRRWIKDSEPDYECVEIMSKVRLAIDALRPTLAQLNFPQPLCTFGDPTEAIVDQIWLERAVGCLLMNAAQAAGEHNKTGAEVTVRVETVGPYVHIMIGDNGPGIDAPPSTGISTKTDGLGLGLYLARTFVETMGGTLHIEGHPNQGTVARIQLQRHRITACSE